MKRPQQWSCSANRIGVLEHLSYSSKVSRFELRRGVWRKLPTFTTRYTRTSYFLSFLLALSASRRTPMPPPDPTLRPTPPDTSAAARRLDSFLRHLPGRATLPWGGGLLPLAFPSGASLGSPFPHPAPSWPCLPNPRFAESYPFGEGATPAVAARPYKVRGREAQPLLASAAGLRSHPLQRARMAFHLQTPFSGANCTLVAKHSHPDSSNSTGSFGAELL
jgi:hypothetical protein